jgi:predicted ATPase
LHRLNAALGLSPEAQAELRAVALPAPRRSTSRLEQQQTLRLVRPALQNDVSPRRAHGALPVQPNSLIGREHELQDLTSVLRRPEVRLLTLTGTGGVGKTRLAVAVAEHIREAFADGAWFVDLSALSDPTLVMPTIAHTLNVPERGRQSMLEDLQCYFGGRHQLVVLDNCEHLLSAALDVAELVSACPDLKVLATSREPWSLRWEHAYPVLPLAVPDPNADINETMRASAVELFVERAHAIDPTFRLTTAVAPSIAQLCACLDGLPLAIELAATQVRLLRPSAMLARIERRLDLLDKGPADIPPRHRSLRAAIDWSYRLLDPVERTIFRRLSVFAGGSTLDAIEAVCAGGVVDQADVLASLGSLVDKSLVVAEDHGLGGRFRLLELLREYAAEETRRAGEEAALRAHHCAWFLQLAELAQHELIGPKQSVWLGRLQQDQGNLRAALAWCQEDQCRTDDGLRLATALNRFWWRAGFLKEGRAWLATALSRSEASRDPSTQELRPRALNAAGGLTRSLGEYSAAQSLFENSRRLAHESGNRANLANALNNLASVAQYQGNNDQAAQLAEESLAIWKELGNAWGRSGPLAVLARLAWQRGEYERAEALNRERLALSLERDDHWATGRALNNLGALACQQGRLAEGVRLLQDSLVKVREFGDRETIASVLASLGRAERHNDARRAIALFTEALALFVELGAQWGVIECLDGIAGTTAASQPERAARLIAFATATRKRLGLTWRTTAPSSHDRDLAGLRSRLGDEHFSVAWAEGWALSSDEAIALALGADGAELAEAWTRDGLSPH